MIIREQIYNLGIKAIIQNSSEKILLLKHIKGYWDFPGGRVQENEEAIDTLFREVKEETGITNLTNIKQDAMILTDVHMIQDNHSIDLILWYFNCTLVTNQKIVLSDEHTEFQWVNKFLVRDLTKLDNKVSTHLFNNYIDDNSR